MAVIRIEDWSIDFTHSDRADFFTPPEMRQRSIFGAVYGHPEKADGTRVKTNAIHRFDGRRVTTRSGTVYHLGEINKLYLERMVKLGYTFNPEDPINGWK